MPVIEVRPQNFKKALGCPDQKWRERPKEMFNKNEAHEFWTKGLDGAISAAYKVAAGLTQPRKKINCFTLFGVLPPAAFRFNFAAMKNYLLLGLFALTFLLAGCHTASVTTPAVSAPAPVSAAPNLTGDWNWVCCEGNFHGEFKVQQDAAGKITGRFFDNNDTVGGALEGSIAGNRVKFSRSWGDDFHQDYSLTLSADGNQLAGDIEGTRDESFGAHFEATRK